MIAWLTSIGWTRAAWAFGVWGPLLCLVLDPGVFRDGAWTAGHLRSIALFVYSLVAMAISALAWVLLCGRAAPFARGVLLAGALFASAVKLVVAPFGVALSAAGLLQILRGKLEIGLVLAPLGVTPLLTSVVFWRYFLRSERPEGIRGSLLSLLGICLTLTVPFALQVAANASTSTSIDRVRTDPEHVAAIDVRRLRAFAFTTNFMPLAFAYHAEVVPTRRTALAAFYLQMTGRDVERDLISAD
jgi:hypothetical protein